MQRLVDLHAPLQTRCRSVGKNECRWLSGEARAAKRRCRRLERRYRLTQAAADRQAYTAARLPQETPFCSQDPMTSKSALPTTPATTPPPGE